MNIISLFFTNIFTAEINRSKDNILEYEGYILKNITNFYIEGENKDSFEGVTKIYIECQRGDSNENEKSFEEDFTKFTLKSLPKGYRIFAYKDSDPCPPLICEYNADAVFYFKETSETVWMSSRASEYENKNVLTKE